MQYAVEIQSARTERLQVEDDSTRDTMLNLIMAMIEGNRLDMAARLKSFSKLTFESPAQKKLFNYLKTLSVDELLSSIYTK
jgi:hypothetical protein